MANNSGNDFTKINLEKDIVIKYDESSNTFVMYTPYYYADTSVILTSLIAFMGYDITIGERELSDDSNVS